jgi:predicted DNA-binding protein with PD1-like motif
MWQKEFVSEKVLVGKLTHDCDVLEELQNICTDNNLRAGSIHVIGAVKKAVIGYFDQETRKYISIELKDETGSTDMEILSITGNISIRDGNPFVHAHITLSDRFGKAYGGHLMPGTVIFAGEYIIQPMKGPDLIREFDNTTSLFLWRED